MKLPLILGSVVGLLALYVGVLSFKLSLTADELEQLVLPHIGDANSAKFTAPLFSVNNKAACMDWIEINVSNWKTASFSHTETGWILNTLDATGCSQIIKTGNTKI